MRSGRFVRQTAGYTAFLPAAMPPVPPVAVEGHLLTAFSAADQALGRLDGVAEILPNPDLFVAMYVKKEAVLSSQIEGTQASLTDVLLFEAGEEEGLRLVDVEEVVNYVGALKYGLERLSTLPLSLRLIREIHARLLQGVRGKDKDPGEFRRTQNWIGPASSDLANARFVPPPPWEMTAALGEFEAFLRDVSLPPLLHAALAHVQFETIHPFLDGNGRVGRLLLTFLLCHRGVLRRPLLYLSHFLKRNRAEYYDRLQAVRKDGNYESWVEFFVRGVAEVATEAGQTARRIVALREEARQLVAKRGRATGKVIALLDLLFEQPILNVRAVTTRLGMSFSAANKAVDRFVALGILVETTGQRRNRRFEYAPYLDLFREAEAVVPGEEPIDAAEEGE